MIYKKGKWQASSKDTWCLKASLSPIIAAGIKRFIETDKYGVPGNRPELGEIGEDFCYVDIEAADEEWHNILNKILYAFENPEEPEIPKGLYDKVFTVGFSDPHSKPELLIPYKESIEEWKEKREEGLRLFVEWFDHMWW